MRPIVDAAGQELVWHRDGLLKREFTLHAGDEPVATLQWQKAFGSLVLYATADGSRTFKRGGFWHPHVTVRTEGSDADIATFEAHMGGGGTLVTQNSTRLDWKPANFWHSQWTWQDPAGTPLIHYRGREGLKLEGHVTIEPAAAARPDLSLLVGLGWYLLVLLAQDRNASVGAASGT